MSQPVPTAEARIPLTVRKLERRDTYQIAEERPRRLPLILQEIPTCYVAVTDEQKLAYMNWVVLSSDWKQFSPYFAGTLHKELGRDECLFEFAYTFEKYRGLGVMGSALASIIHQTALEHPYLRWGYTYVLDSNVPSLKGCGNAGFRPYMRREERWRAMSMHQEFVSLNGVQVSGS